MIRPEFSDSRRTFARQTGRKPRWEVPAIQLLAENVAYSFSSFSLGRAEATPLALLLYLTTTLSHCQDFFCHARQGKEIFLQDHERRFSRFTMRPLEE